MTLRLLAFAACAALHAAPAEIDFVRDVQPLFRAHCVSCHGAAQQMGKFRLDRRRDAMRGGSIAVIAPGTSAGSRLFHKITSTKFGTKMPPTGPLPEEAIEVIKRWLDQGAKWPDEASGDVEPAPADPAVAAVLQQIRRGQFAAARSAIDADPAVLNRRGPAGISPLHYAVLYWDAAAVGWLLEKGAAVNAANDAGATALHWAAGDLKITERLLDAGARADARSADGTTPLSVAAGRRGAAEAVRALVEKGATADPVVDGDDESFATLFEKTRKGNAVVTAIRSECAPCVEQSVSAAGPNDVSLAMAAAASLGNLDLTRRFAALGAGTPKPNADGFTALMRAAAREDAKPEVLQVLLEKGSDLNARTQNGDTALDYAVRHGETSAVAALRKAGAIPGKPAPAVAVRTRPSNSVREALDRSLPLLGRVDDVFLRQSGCVSCHNNSLYSFTLELAKRNGYRDDAASAERQRKAIGPYIENWRERALQGIGIPGGPDTVSYILMGLDAIRYPADPATDALAHYLLGRQRPDGRWSINTHRPPIEASAMQLTAVSARALQAYGISTKKADYQRAIQRAGDWLEQASARTTEDRAFQVLGLVWLGRKATEPAKRLLREQREDGGWAQIPSLASDAYATGQAMVALRESGLLKASSPAYRKAVQFLLRTQTAEGAWYVRSRAVPFQPHFETGFPFGTDQWVSTAATNWAAMGLLLARGADRSF